MAEKLEVDGVVSIRKVQDVIDVLCSEESYVPDVALREAVNRACRDLPDGWQIHITLEKGAGWSEVYDPHGANRTSEINLSDKDLPESIGVCVDYAIKGEG